VQVGVGRRVIVLDVPQDEEAGGERSERRENLMALINPEVVEASGSVKFDEGCLSVPGVTAEVTRASDVRVRALGPDGEELDIEASGLLAIALQHETDHLDGILFIDRLSRLKRELIKRRIRKAREAEARVL